MARREDNLVRVCGPHHCREAGCGERRGGIGGVRKAAGRAFHLSRCVSVRGTYASLLGWKMSPSVSCVICARPPGAQRVSRVRAWLLCRGAGCGRSLQSAPASG